MIYLDNAATTPVCEQAAKAANTVLTQQFGNASSLYDLGFQSGRVLETARAAVAKALGCDKGEVLFTGGGTESNNLAVLGAARARRAWADNVVITGYEHPSVHNAAMALKEEGFSVTVIAPDAHGHVDPEAILAAVNKKTALVAAMHVNNETGAMLDAASLAEEVHAINRRTAVHCDNVQGFLKEKLPLGDIDTVSVSAHKVHGPKGFGALYVRRGFNLGKVLFGGLQEKSMRPGTENVAYAAAFAAAIEAAPAMAAEHRRVTQLNTLARTLAADIPGAVINSPADASPYILNLSLVGYRSEILLHFLEQRGIYVSSGSACSKREKSHTLSAMALPAKRIDSAVRLSFSDRTTAEEIETAMHALREATETLVRAD